MEDLHEAKTGGLNLLFSDELSGTEFELRDLNLRDATDVQDELDSDVPEFGRWIAVETDDGEGYAVAPGELIEELQLHAAEPGDEFRITRCEKSGPEEAAPFEVNIEAVDQSQQTGLTD